jgi:hypothetical protein
VHPLALKEPGNESKRRISGFKVSFYESTTCFASRGKDVTNGGHIRGGGKSGINHTGLISDPKYCINILQFNLVATRFLFIFTLTKHKMQSLGCMSHKTY